ncbi:MAG: glycosyltransferase [Candidatus Eisenbacteria bacterium]|nr:glycosyltransferase [Candidatus Eisenbacteria bacterium]
MDQQSAGGSRDRGLPAVRVLPVAPMTILGIYSWTRLWSMGQRAGAESFSLSLQAFPRYNHTLHVVAPREAGQPTFEELDGIRLHRLPAARDFLPNPFRQPRAARIAERIGKYAAFQWASASAAVELGRRIRPDAVVAYGAFAVPAARWTAMRLGVPNVTRLFGQSLNLCVGNRLKFYGNFPEIFAMKCPAAYVILHDDGAEGDIMARRLKVPAERFRYWKNGIDPDFYQPDLDTLTVRHELGWGPNEIILFAVARMVYEKHLERLVGILPRLLEAEPRIRLLLVGDGPKRPETETLAQELGVADKVRFVGAQPREALPRFFNTGDIFCSVSDRTNGGNPTVEAMYCGRCAVVLNTGGTARLVEDGRTGIVIEPERLEELPARILEAARDPELRRRLGSAAREEMARQMPTIAERQKMEVDLVAQAVAEARR